MYKLIPEISVLKTIVKYIKKYFWGSGDPIFNVFKGTSRILMLILYAKTSCVIFKITFLEVLPIKYKNYKKFQLVTLLGLDERVFTTHVLTILPP